jgi:outer membrane immunogenic protein
MRKCYARSAESKTGLYVGGHTGGQWVSVDHTYDIGAAAQHTFGYNADGFVGGVHAGYNGQIGHVVLGIKVDTSWSNAKGSGLCTAACAGTGSHPTIHLDNTTTVRGRLGYAVDRTLLYVTADRAISDVRIRDTLQLSSG